jgi:Tfp pilus assembly PilM family ATPase
MFSFLEKIKDLFAGNSSTFALNFSDTHIQELKLDAKGEVLAFGEEKIPTGMIENGEILEEKMLAKGIQMLLQNTKPESIQSANCMIALPETQTYEHIFYLSANLKGRAFKKELEKKIEETIPLPFTEVKYVYNISSVLEQTQVVYVVAAKREVIAQYYQVLKDHCGLSPKVLEPELLSLLRNIPQSMKTEEGSIFIDIDSKKIRWFALWNTAVFDTSSIEKADLNNNCQNLIQELKKATEVFTKITKRKVTAILVSGNDTDSTTLTEALTPTLKIPITTIENYKLSPPPPAGRSILDYKVLGGLALKANEGSSTSSINIFK